MPTLCMVSDAAGPFDAIGKVAADGVTAALDAGYRVTVVAHRIAEPLRPHVEWVKLYVPSRVFAYKWLTGRHWIRRALGDRKFDVLHVHQPQVANLADVFHCHFLTRVAYERHCLEGGTSLRSRVVRVQQQVVLHAEDYCYRGWNPATRMLFVSELVRDEFARLYGPPPRQEVFPNACPPVEPLTDAERQAARQELVGDWPGPVVGFLGGVQHRKGFPRLVAGLREDPAAFLLLAGTFTEHCTPEGLHGRVRGLGVVHDLRRFFAACDVLAVPSGFDPCPLVVYEAAAHGVPTIVGDGVGNAAEVVRQGAGVLWANDDRLGDVLARVTGNRAAFAAGAARLTSQNTASEWKRRLLAIYADVLAARSKGAIPPPAAPA